MYHIVYCSVIHSMVVATYTDTSILTITLVESKLDIVMMNNFVSHYHLPQMIPFLIAGHNYPLHVPGNNNSLNEHFTGYVCPFTSIAAVTRAHRTHTLCTPCGLGYTDVAVFISGFHLRGGKHLVPKFKGDKSKFKGGATSY